MDDKGDQWNNNVFQDMDDKVHQWNYVFQRGKFFVFNFQSKHNALAGIMQEISGTAMS